MKFTLQNFTMHPELPAVDIKRARVWYRDKLGLFKDSEGNMLAIGSSD